MMLSDYLPILVFLAVGLGLGLVMLSAGALLSKHNPDPEKNSPYECGFEAFESSRIPFDVRFYLVAILFIIFDVEAVFLFPWAVIFMKTAPAVFYEMMVFIGILFFGVVYGWRKGVLQWR